MLQVILAPIPGVDAHSKGPRRDKLAKFVARTPPDRMTGGEMVNLFRSGPY